MSLLGISVGVSHIRVLSGMLAGLVDRMFCWLDLEGAVTGVEMVTKTVGQSVEHLIHSLRVESSAINHHMG